MIPFILKAKGMYFKKVPGLNWIIIETVNAICVIFEYVRHNFVSVIFLLNKIFVSQMIVEIFDI